MVHCEVNHIVISVVFHSSEKQSQWKCCTVRGTQGNGAQSYPFLWLGYGTGGRKASLSTSAEKWLHTSCGRWYESVNSHSEMHVRPPAPPISLRNRERTWGSNVLLVEAATVSITQLCYQTRVAWRNVLYKHYRSDRKLCICSTLTFTIQIPRSLQLSTKDISRQGLLSFGFSYDEINSFFFFSLNLDDYFHSAPGWCRKASHEPHTCSQSLLICFFFLSLSWILDLTCQFHICISPFLCVNCTSLSTGLHFLLQAAWTLTSHPVFSCTFSSGLISYIYLAENL